MRVARFAALLPQLMRECRMEPRGIVHVGAHRAQEADAYRAAGFRRMVWVEPQSELAAELRARGLDVVECAVGTEPGRRELLVPENTQRASLLPPLAMRVAGRTTVRVRRLDQLDIAGCNALVVDVQGAELDVLRSGSLNQFDLIVVECCHRRRYAGQADPESVHQLLSEAGFRYAARAPHRRSYIVDRFYVRSEVPHGRAATDTARA